MRQLARAFAALGALMAVSAAPANALLCNALLGCSCSVSVTPMAFANINALAGASTTSDVHIGCTGVIDLFPSVAVKFSKGNGTFAARQMKSGAQILPYNIYDQGGAIVGDGTGGYAWLTMSGGVLTLGAWSATEHAYGVVPVSSSARTGAYSDTITVRIDW